jgi:hypothetical protein
MSQQTSNPKQECKCEGSKKMKTLEKQVSDLYAIVADLTKEIATLRRAVRK